MPFLPTVPEAVPRRKFCWTSRAHWLTLSAVIAFDIGMRVHDLLLRPELWEDEAATVMFARLPWREFWRVISAREANMVLYYLIMRPWTAFSIGEMWVRVPSAIFAVLSTIAIYRLAAVLFARRTALLAAAIFVLNPLHIYYAQEARGYSLLMLAIALSTEMLVRAIRSGSLRAWLAYGCFAGLCEYVHIFFALIIAAHMCIYWSTLERKSRIDRAALGFAAAFLLSAPMLAFAFFRNIGQIAWVPPLSVDRVAGNLYVLLGVVPVPAVCAACGIAGAIWMLFSMRSSRSHALPQVVGEPVPVMDGGSASRAALVTAMLSGFVPFALLLALNLRQPTFFGRYLSVAAPGVCLTAGAGLAGIAQWLRRESARGTVLLGAVLGLSIIATALAREDSILRQTSEVAPTALMPYREIEHAIVSHASPDEGLVIYHRGDYPLDYYQALARQRGLANVPQMIYPTNGDVGYLRREPNRVQLSDYLRPKLDGLNGVWLVSQYTLPAEENALEDFFRGHFREERRLTVTSRGRRYDDLLRFQVTLIHYVAK